MYEDLKFQHAKNGTLKAQYITRNADKAAAIIEELHLRGYSATVTPVLHLGQNLIVTVVGNRVKASDVDTMTATFRAGWKEMRDAMKVATAARESLAAAATTAQCATSAVNDASLGTDGSKGTDGSTGTDGVVITQPTKVPGYNF